MESGMIYIYATRIQNGDQHGTAELLLNRSLEQCTDVQTPVRYHRNEHGKPYLTDHSFFISISHTKGYVAVMLASFTPAGIDIEQYAQRVHKVSDRYIRSDEQTEPYQGDMTWGLLLHWSAKEAVFKRMENADADLRKLRLTHFIPQEQGTFQVQELATEQQELYSVGYRICPDFVLTWTLS